MERTSTRVYTGEMIAYKYMQERQQFGGFAFKQAERAQRQYEAGTLSARIALAQEMRVA